MTDFPAVDNLETADGVPDGAPADRVLFPAKRSPAGLGFRDEPTVCAEMFVSTLRQHNRLGPLFGIVVQPRLQSLTGNGFSVSVVPMAGNFLSPAYRRM